MKAAFILALMISQATLMIEPAAAAPPANRRAEAEARSFLVPCSGSRPDWRSSCALNRQQFVENYVLAKSGDPMWMNDIVSRLDQEPVPALDGAAFAGIRHDRRQACAWMIATTESTTELARIDALRGQFSRRCAGVSANEMRATQERAEVLLWELRHDPTTPPKEPEVECRDCITTVPDE